MSKSSIQLHGINESGKPALKKKFSRNEVTAFIAKLPPFLIELEACGGADYWVRTFTKFEHKVRMIAPQFVKPYVKSNKNDAVDAEAIYEAVQHAFCTE